MPEFSSPFSGLNADRKLTKNEVIRTIRYSISAEYEAIQIYEQIADSTDNELVKKVMIDVANEEKVHAGEFLKLLNEMTSEEFEFYKNGQSEVDDMKDELKKGK